MLEIGAVVDARRQQHDHRIAHAARRKRPQDLAQLGRIVPDRQHLVLMERVGEGARHDGAVFEHVGDAARRAHVVFEHQVLAGFRIADQVDAGDVRVDPGGRPEPDHLPPEMLAGVDQRPRNSPVLENLLRPVDVLQEQVERDHALAEPALDVVPLGARQDARREVEGEKPLGAAPVAIDGKGDSLQQKRQIRELATLFELSNGHSGQLFVDLRVMRPGNALRREHLVVERTWVVVPKEIVLRSHLRRQWQ